MKWSTNVNPAKRSAYVIDWSCAVSRIRRISSDTNERLPRPNVGLWHVASFRGDAALQSLSETEADIEPRL